MGKDSIKLIGDDFDSSPGENRYSYEFDFDFDCKDIQDDSESTLNGFDKKYAFEELVKKFAIKLRVNIYDENPDDLIGMDIPGLLDVPSDTEEVNVVGNVLDNAKEHLDMSKYKIEAKIEFDIEEPFMVESETMADAIKQVTQACMERFNIPVEAIKFKSTEILEPEEEKVTEEKEDEK